MPTYDEQTRPEPSAADVNLETRPGEGRRTVAVDGTPVAYMTEMEALDATLALLHRTEGRLTRPVLALLDKGIDIDEVAKAANLSIEELHKIELADDIRKARAMSNANPQHPPARPNPSRSCCDPSRPTRAKISSFVRESPQP